MNKNIKKLIALFCAVLMLAPSAAFAADASDSDEPANYLKNNGFETSVWDADNGWAVGVDSWEGGNTVASDDNYIHSGNSSMHYWFEEARVLTLTQTLSLEAGEYDFGGYFHGADSNPSIEINDGSGNNIVTSNVALAGWGTWVEAIDSVTIAESGDYTFIVKINCAAGGWGNFDDLFIREHTEAAPEEPDTDYSKVMIAPVAGLSPDFMRGVDVSSVIALENAGIKYYNQEGKEEDIFKILHDSGVNTIRVRIWNDPYDADGNGYGGGNNDLETAKLIARRAADNDLKLYVDFHYSDFWAAPNKQQKPKAWKDMSSSEICKALSEYTDTALKELAATGAEISIVQIGNETSGYFLGSKKWSTMAKYFKAGTKAVRSFDPDIKIMIQFGGSRNVSKYDGFCKNLKKYKIDYDIVGASYYPFYASSGTFSNLKKNLNNIIKKYGKEVMVVENAYPVSFDDYDGQGNNFSFEEYSALPKQMTWDVSPQGQAQEIRDVIELVSNLNKGKGTGSHSTCCYTVKNYADSNSGGSNWENLAMFDQDGRAFDSLNVFNYVYTGSEGDGKPYITSVESPEVVIKASDFLTEDEVWHQIWWNQVNCTYSDGSQKWTDVKWISMDGKPIVQAYMDKKLGDYTFHGVVKDFNNTMATMKVRLLGDQDYIESCTLSKTSYTYNGKNHKPTVTVMNKNGKKITKGKSYTVTYEKDSKSVGTHTVLVTGINKYDFSFVLEYEIKPKTKK